LLYSRREDNYFSIVNVFGVFFQGYLIYCTKFTALFALVKLLKFEKSIQVWSASPDVMFPFLDALNFYNLPHVLSHPLFSFSSTKGYTTLST